MARIAGTIPLALLWATLAASPAAAANPCTVTIDGHDLESLASPDQALPVRADQVVQVDGSAPRPPGALTIELEFSPASIPIAHPTPGGGTTWSGPVDLSQWSVPAAGLYRLRVTTDLPECPPIAGWIRIDGPSPLTTVPGLIGIGSIVAGIGILLFALRSAAAGRGRLLRGALGGALAGVGALVVAQQAGLVPIDARNAATWAALPGVAGAGITDVVSRLRMRSAAAPATAPGTAGGGAEAADVGSPMGGSTETGIPGAGATHAEPPLPGSGGAGPGPAAGAEPELPATGGAHAEPPVEGDSGAGPATGAESEPVAANGDGAGAGPATGAESEPVAANGGEGGGVGVGAAAGTTVTTSTPADPPRVSYARLEAPAAVVTETSFDVLVGLAAEADPDVDAEPIVRPAWSVGPYTLSVQLLADGFRPPEGTDPWRVDLPVTAEAPYPAAVLKLVAEATPGDVRRRIRAVYSIQGQAVGVAARAVMVVTDAARLAAVQPETIPGLIALSTPRGQDAPDITVTIEPRTSDGEGSYSWQLLARDDLGVARPSSDPLTVDLGSDASTFLAGISSDVRENEHTALLKGTLDGIGLQIARQMPRAFWELYDAVAASVAPRPAAIQIISSEPYVPWELAAREDPKTPGDNVFLAAQADVGRWVLAGPPPVVPPPATLEVRAIAVISGIFGEADGAGRLEEAEAEATALEDTYQAVSVGADTESVARALQGDPAVQILHFAVHGSVNPETDSAGIVLTDGHTLGERAVLAARCGAPLVFLNACQVGKTHETLGDYAGIAAAFLYAGAVGVVAPLWSIDDAAAREIALRFYERVFAGTSPSDALRQERASFMSSPETSSSTFLAYQYYGHPLLRITRG